MILVHGTNNQNGSLLNYYEDDMHINLVQERNDGIYVYYQNYKVKDLGKLEELVQKYGFNLVGKKNKS